MAAKVEWLFSILDKTSGPADTMAKKLALVERRLEGIKRAEASALTDRSKDRLMFARMNLDIQKHGLLAQASKKHTSDLIGKWAHWITLIGAAGSAISSVTSAIGSAAMKTGELVYAFAKAGAEAAAFKESQMLAMETLIGNPTEARGFFQKMVGYAAKTPFETSNTLEWSKMLLLGGFNTKEVPTVMKAVGDLAAMRGNDSMVIDRAITALSQIMAKGVMQGEELQQLAEAGVSRGRVMQVLGKRFGVSSTLDIEKLIQSKKIDSITGTSAIVETIRETVSGGKLGKAQERLATTLPGILSTLKSRPFELMMNLDKSGGYQKLKGALSNFALALDPSTEIGARVEKRLADAFNRITTSIFGAFSGTDGLKNVETLINRLLGALERLVLLGRLAWNVLAGTISGFLQGRAIFDSLEKPLDPQKMEKLALAAHDFGEQLGRALDKLVKLVDFMGKFHSKLLPVSFDRKLDQLGIGQLAAQTLVEHLPGGGLIRGVREGIGLSNAIDRISAWWNSPPKIPVPKQSYNHLNRPVSSTINVSVNAPGATKESAGIIADQTSTKVRDQFNKMWSDMAMSQGAM